MAGTNGIVNIKKNVQNIKTRKYIATIFCLDQETKSEYREIMSIKRNIKAKNDESDSTSSSSSSNPFLTVSSVVETSSSIRDVPRLETLKKHFLEMKYYLEKDRCYYIAYDFGFFNEANAFRTIVCLISYIPDDLREVADKFIYSRNSLSLKDELEIGKPLTINNWNNLTYEYIQESCSSYSRF